MLVLVLEKSPIPPSDAYDDFADLLDDIYDPEESNW
jgi:hypothetical protein